LKEKKYVQSEKKQKNKMMIIKEMRKIINKNIIK